MKLRCAIALSSVLAFASLALAQEAIDDTAPKGRIAATPEEAVSLLKAAWDARDDRAVVARYADPGASSLRRELAALRRLESAQAALLKAAAPLGAPNLADLGLDEVHPRSPFAGEKVSVTLGDLKIEGDRATGRLRVESLDGVRETRTILEKRAGDWKIILATPDGTPLDSAALLKIASTADAREKTATEIESVTKELASGRITSRNVLKKRLAQIAERERTALEKSASGSARTTKPSGEADDGDDD
jgi:hypothetical protein